MILYQGVFFVPEIIKINMSNYIDSTIYFATSDLSLATTISLWYPLEFVDQANPTKAQFLFKREDHLDELVASYWKRELKVEPQEFFSQLRSIKSRLYETR